MKRKVALKKNCKEGKWTTSSYSATKKALQSGRGRETEREAEKEGQREGGMTQGRQREKKQEADIKGHTM